MNWTKGDTRALIHWLVWVTITALTILLLGGCSPQWHIQKALKKDPAIIQNDTVIYTDTVWREIQKVDTIVRLRTVHDTVEYIQDSVIVKLVKLPNDSVFIDVDCPDCPEITRTNTITKTITIKDTIWQAISRTWWLIFVLPVVYFIIRLKA